MDPHHVDVDPDSEFHWMRIRIRILFDADADPDPTFHPDADPDLDAIYEIKAQTREKCPNMLIFHTFWHVICKLMRIRIQIINLMRIQVTKMMRIHADRDPDANPDPQHWVPVPGYLCVIVILIQTKTQMWASSHETSVSTFCPYLIGSSYCYLIGFNLNV